MFTERPPRDSIAIERLDLLTRPDVGSLYLEENFALAADDGLHDNVVQETAL
jgi:hypothetical protein